MELYKGALPGRFMLKFRNEKTRTLLRILAASQGIATHTGAGFDEKAVARFTGKSVSTLRETMNTLVKNNLLELTFDPFQAFYEEKPKYRYKAKGEFLDFTKTIMIRG
jgi:hypothetical protein